MSWKKEAGRKAFHLSWGLVLLGYLYLEKAYGTSALYLPLSLLMLALVIDFFRIEFSLKIPVFHRLLHEKEADSLFAPTTTMFGIAVALAVFDKSLASAAILIMVFGDIAGNVAGRTLGKHRLKNGKSIEGSIAMFIVSFGISYPILTNIYVTVAMALAGTLAELFTQKLDDNMIVTLFSGATGHILLRLL